MKFPLTLSAIKTAENDQWAIGDALIAECGRSSHKGLNDGSQKLLQEAGRYLLAEGYDYNTSTLVALRNTACSFGLSQRQSNISFNTHRVAGTPEYLNAIIAGAPKGMKITQRYIEGIRSTQQEKARRERERQAQKAIAAREKAEAEEAEARKKAREAKAAEEKAAAQIEAEKAARKTEKARENERATRTAPRPKITPPEPKEVPQLVAETQFLAHAARSVVLAREATKDLKACIAQLNSVSIAGLTEAALEAANAWTEAARIVRSEVQEQRGHLSVVGE